MHPLADKYLRKEALPFIFCPGCGDGTILNTTLHAIDELGIREDLALVGGIGCSGWLPVYIDADVLHVTHGRAIPYATGLKLSDPNRKVLVFTGDGDCVGIGGNHFIHGCRRNIDLTVVMINNQIYGMTGGQLAPTTPRGAETQTSPLGNPETPFDACELAESAGATHVARWTTGHPFQLVRALKEALEHCGFAFIEVLSQCPVQAGRYMRGTSDPVELMEQLKGETVHVDRAAELSAADLDGKFLIGTLHRDEERPELSEQVYRLQNGGDARD